MKTIRYGLIACTISAAMSLAVAAASANWSTADMNRQIDQTNFVVNSGCSGTLIDTENRYILTANHCITAQYETVERERVKEDGTITTEKYRRLKPGNVKQLQFNGPLQVQETTYRTEVVAFDSKRDLAVVKILAPIPNTDAARFACGEPVRGEKVFIVGNPMGNLYSSVVSGMISSIQRTYGLIGYSSEDKVPLMQISGGVVGGNSGGAVYDASGQLIGVPVLGHRMNETLAFAVPLHDIKDFLKEKNLDGVYSYCAAAE
jgi:S1-C subfamily serine protease